jgi:hypothetical protein
MFEFQKLTVDSAEVEEKLKGTQLRMPGIAKKMMSAANRAVIRQAKANVKSQFEHRNTHPDDSRNIPILKSFKSKNAKRESFVSYVMARTMHAAVQEKGAAINPKNGKYLTYRINGEWRKSRGVTIPARPFLQPAVNEIYNSGKAKEIMQAALQKALDKYWEKQGA